MKCYTTNAGGAFRESRASFVRDDRAEMRLIVVRPDIEYQRIVGFGGAFTESAASVFALMPPDKQDAFLVKCFGPASLGGNAYSLCRTHIQSCDFALGGYSYVRPYDRQLNSFSIDRDRRLLLPFIKCGLAANPHLQLFASPWSPPAFMKSNRRRAGGGRLRGSLYGAWAGMLVKYVQAYEREGVPIGRMSVQNEPAAQQSWESCLFSPQEEAVFAAEYLRPALDHAGLRDVKLFAWDHNTDRILDRLEQTFAAKVANHVRTPVVHDVLAAPEGPALRTAGDAFGGVAFHWYAGDHFEQLEELSRRFPDKELMFTEGCVEYSRPQERLATQEHKAEQYAHSIIGCVGAGAAGYIDWNMLLDERGGPNHARNFCEAPLMYDRDAGELVENRSFQYIGHFSRFAVPGSRRCLTSRFSDALECVGFVRPDSDRVLVVLNRHGRKIRFRVAERPFVADLEIPGHSVMTLLWSREEAE